MAILKDKKCKCGGSFKVYKGIYNGKTLVSAIICKKCGFEKPTLRTDFYDFVTRHCIKEK